MYIISIFSIVIGFLFLLNEFYKYTNNINHFTKQPLNNINKIKNKPIKKISTYSYTKPPSKLFSRMFTERSVLMDY